MINFTVAIPPPIPSAGEPSGTLPPVTSSTTTVSFGNMVANQTASMPISNPVLPITDIILKTDEAVSGVTVTVESVPSTSASISIVAPGNVYSYLEIHSTAPSTSLAEVKVLFKVPKSWGTTNNIDPTTITLNHLVNGAWVDLPTTKINEDGDYYYFSAVTPSLSYFAITAQTMTVTTPPAGCSACPAAGEWSECTDGMQSRSAYACSAATNYSCLATQETEPCGIGLHPPAAIGNTTAWILIGLIVVGVVGYGFYKSQPFKYKYRPPYKFHRK
jgi:PGF-pre-PGF domain-containing protein